MYIGKCVAEVSEQVNRDHIKDAKNTVPYSCVEISKQNHPHIKSFKVAVKLENIDCLLTDSIWP